MVKTRRINLKERGQLLVSLLAMMAHAMMSVVAEAPVTAWAADTIAVDAATFRMAVAPKMLRCSPDWCTGGTNVSGATYTLMAVTAPDTPQAATSSVPVSASSAEGDVPYGGASGYVRFIMKADVSGTPVGETLVSDVSFGASATAAAATCADSRTNSLQEAIYASGIVDLTYSSLWADNAAAVTLRAVKLSGRGGTAMATNEFFTASGVDAEGLARLNASGKGWWRLLCQVMDGTDGVLLEYLTDEFYRRGGIMLNFR